VYDSHCHLDFPVLAESLQDHLQRARDQGVRRWHVPGCGPSQWDRLARLAGVQGVSLSVGIHPWWAEEVFAESTPEATIPAVVLEEAMQKLARRAHQLGAVAIGECGLDRPRARAGGTSLPLQRALFEAQLVVAREMALPVVLHVVGEHGQAITTLDRVGRLPAGGVVHAYSGSAELVDLYVARGFMLGWGPRLTYPNARRARAALQRVPLDGLLLETDAPDQAPWGQDGPRVKGRGIPGDLAVVAKTAAQLLSRPAAELSRITWNNARRLFG
jgi:TatD DNase family protein